MPKLDPRMPETPDAQIQDLQFNFTGEWQPDRDPLTIGGENFADLLNLRYKDGGLEGVNGYTEINTTPIGTYTNIQSGYQHKSEFSSQRTYNLIHTADGSGQGRVYVNRTAIPSQGDFDAAAYFDTSGNAYFEDANANLTGRFSSAPAGAMAYSNGEESLLYNGDEMRVSAAFTVDDGGTVPANPFDQTEAVNNELQTTTEKFTYAFATQPFMVLMSARPIRGIKFYVSSANVAAATMTVKYWTGSAWAAVSSGVDGTDVGGATLGQTGTYTFDYVEGEPKHYEELYMYAYLVEIDAGTADIYHMTLQAPFQPIIDIWDGVYRQPIQAQFYDNSATKYEDFTLYVNESSDVNTPIGMELDGMANADKVYLQFEKPMTAIKFTMLSGLVNTNASVLDVDYWDGDSWVDCPNLVDGTSDGGKTFNQTGTVSWSPADDEKPKTQFGTYGYVYRFDVTATLTGTHGDATEECYVDLVTGIPAQIDIKPFKFPVQYKSRLMMVNFEAGNEGNRVDYSVNNTPDAWNGFDSSDDGFYSLYFGGNDAINNAVQLYNRFGSNIFATLVVLKNNETYLMVGDTADDFRIYPVSFNIGCPAPLTLATAEVGFEVSRDAQRNVAMWVSHSGPVMFDGAVLVPMRGIDNYFDPNETSYINTAQYSKCRGWFDSVYKEYNLLIPTGSSTVVNTWLVYDLYRRKWYRKDTGTADFPRCGWKVADTDGASYVYAGMNTGTVMRLENGTNWNGVGITQRVRSGDIIPSNNIWDITRIRKMKIIAKRVQESNTLSVKYYGDTVETSGVGVSFQDSTDNNSAFTDSADISTTWASVPSTTFDLSVATGLERLVTRTQDLNRLGWAHAFEWEITTDDTTKGFQPIAWGIQYIVERKSDTAD
jgi:hypothetical protein